ncbi:transposase [Acidomonas methanolica]|nr:putative transposase [Acidomonas methanolica]GBQ48872.1 transposase [Acidomonas methanolica]GEK99651.1 hypothetical protein AME01nite_21500 [Acidomonas methanolica NBRC 104435]
MMSAPFVSYRRHCFPRKLSAHTVWLYFRFPLSFRSVEEMLLGRGIIVSCETIRRWSLRFGAASARSLRRRTAKPGDVWHLDEVRIVVGGQPHWLWRVVDQDGCLLDEILQKSRRNARAAKRLPTRLLRRQGAARPVDTALSRHLHRVRAFAQWSVATTITA